MFYSVQEGLLKGTTDAAKESKCMLEMESRSSPNANPENANVEGRPPFKG